MSVIVAALANFLVLHPLTPGRALHAVKGIRAQLTLDEAAVLEPKLAAAAEQARGVRRLNALWRAGRKLKKGRAGVMQLDARVDGLLGSTFEHLRRVVRSLAPAHPHRKFAELLLAEHFPDGAGALTRLPFEEELDEAEALLEALQAEANQRLVAELGLVFWRDQLAEALPEYDAAIRQRAGNPLAFAEVRAARLELQERVAAVQITILYLSLGQPDVRARLGAPLQEQHDKISAAYRAQVRPKDVDEESGAELELPIEEDEPPVA